MRHMPLAAAACLALAACGEPADPSLASLAGPTNIAALEASVACRNDEALRLTGTEIASQDPARRLMAHYTRAAVLTDLGREAEAQRLIAAAAADPRLNPEGRDAATFGQPASAIQQQIREARIVATGTPTC